MYEGMELSTDLKTAMTHYCLGPLRSNDAPHNGRKERSDAVERETLLACLQVWQKS